MGNQCAEPYLYYNRLGLRVQVGRVRKITIPYEWRGFMPERNQKRKAMRVRSLRQRWILNSALPVFMLLALAVGGMSIGISNYY